MEKLHRWISKHKVAGFIIAASLYCGLYAILFMMIKPPLWLCILLELLLIFFCHSYVQNAHNLILKKSIKTLNEHCDPYPLLQDTSTFLSYKNGEFQRQVLVINHCAALMEIGEYNKAYELMKALNIDQCNGMVPVHKAVYYTNLSTICFDLKLWEEEAIWFQKANQLYDSLKPSKAKQNAQTAITLGRARHLLMEKQYEQAMALTTGLPVTHLRDGIGIAFLQGMIYAAQGNTEKAKESLGFVAQYGYRLAAVKEAKKLLEQLH